MQKKFKVSVEKRMYATGIVEVSARTPELAQTKVEKMIMEGKLQTNDIEWSEPEYEDCSLFTTGDVD